MSKQGEQFEVQLLNTDSGIDLPRGTNVNRIVLYSTVPADGVLKLTLPPSTDTVDREVRVIVEPVHAREMTQEEWQRGILETAGKWQGELVRPDQGEFQERIPLS